MNVDPKGTSDPDKSGPHTPGQPDIPEENNRRPAHDGQPEPDNDTDSADLNDVQDGTDADRAPMQR